MLKLKCCYSSKNVFKYRITGDNLKPSSIKYAVKNVTIDDEFLITWDPFISLNDYDKLVGCYLAWKHELYFSSDCIDCKDKFRCITSNE